MLAALGVDGIAEWASVQECPLRLGSPEGRCAYDPGVTARRDRLVTKTSSGHALLLFDVTGPDSALVLGVDAFDDAGWVSGVGQWRSDSDDASLAEFLRRTLSIPQAEAESLSEVVREKWAPEWERSGGHERSRRISKQAAWMLATIAITALLALVGIALALLLLID